MLQRFRRKKRRAIFSADAAGAISSSIRRAGNRYEVGGVLLGYHRFHTCFIIAATVPSLKQREKSDIRFELDGTRETKEAARIARQYQTPPKVIGLWHSHVGGSERFSVRDRRANQKFAKLNGGAVSVIAVPDRSGAFGAALEKLVPYYIDPDGRECLCLSVYGKAGRIPGRYLRRRKRMTDPNHRCSKCVYWVHGVCKMTGERRNDGICTCGQFRERKK